jgi:hypothetical protein
VRCPQVALSWRTGMTAPTAATTRASFDEKEREGSRGTRSDEEAAISRPDPAADCSLVLSRNGGSGAVMSWVEAKRLAA